ncbi:MAG: Trk family potassium uptake protein [Firmicutes bacterium]|nr:Trk family potassium uptake protein [Bacillota bacterium]
MAPFLSRTSVGPRLSPAQFLVLGYTGVIFLGALLLALPAATVRGESMGFLDALFTSTSGVCVTGLTVVNTGSDLSLFGQVVVMVLIQIGALGIMTMSTLFALLTGRRISLRGRLFLKEDLNQGYIAGMVRLVRYCLAFTLAIQCLGALSLWVCFMQEMPWQKALYYAIFHSISAFGNAGFDITGNSLSQYVTNFPINLTVALLIITGGLGFGVMVDIYEERSWRHLSLHTKTVLKMTLLLILTGWVVVGLLEWHNPETLGGLSISGRIMASFFTAVTPRTAGFNTLSTQALSSATLFILMGLMFVGASPGSTGGGVKTTTMAVIWAGLLSAVKGDPDVNLSHRRLPAGDFGKAVAIITLSSVLIFLITGILLMTEGQSLMVTLFEVVSAFGTVGLSVGLTPNLSPVGKVLIMVTMFCGRIGPMTLALALGQRSYSGRYRYPEEKVSLG